MELKIKKVLSRELKTRNISLNALAKATSIPVSSLHNWINSANPSAKSLAQVFKLAKFLNLSISEILFDQKEEASTNEILFSTTFKDGQTHYKLTIEKIRGSQ